MHPQKALVTGGAGGIGEQVVMQLRQRNYDVVIADMNIELGNEVASRHGAIFEQVNLLIPAQIQRLREQVGPINHLVCVAGNPPQLENLTAAQGLKMLSEVAIQQSIGLNLTAQIFLLQAFFDDLVGTDEWDATVTLVSSVNKDRAFCLPAYSAAKAGLIGLMRSMIPFLGAQGARINTISPGTTPTPAQINDGKDYTAIRLATPLKRLTTPEDVAAAILFSIACRSMNGQELIIDAGQIVMAPSAQSHERQ